MTPQPPKRVVVGLAAFAVLAFSAVMLYQSRHRFAIAPDQRVALPDDRGSILPAAPALRFFESRPIGNPFAPKDRPLVAQVTIVDLDADGLTDIVACDVLANRVVWVRQFPRGTFSETALGAEVRAPAHAAAVDLDGDGDLDLVVASLGVMFPSNAKIGSVVVLENDGRGHFSNRVLIDG